MKLSEKDFFYTIVHFVLHGNVEVSVFFSAVGGGVGMGMEE